MQSTYHLINQFSLVLYFDPYMGFQKGTIRGPQEE